MTTLCHRCITKQVYAWAQDLLEYLKLAVPAVFLVRKCICLTDLEQTTVASLVLAGMQQ